MRTHTNELIHETSPYLLQHAHNPVDWYPWGDTALNKAQKENKLIIVSVGYAACHWCHVMEHESFEDSTVANLMNQYYVSIKVDREERPDVDQAYMDAAQVMTGQGGWPLNVICMPDGRPIYAGTYFPKKNWLDVLQGVWDFYKKTPEKALEQADNVQNGVSQMSLLKVGKPSDLDEQTLAHAATDWINNMDEKKGGRRGNIKFPMPASLLVLLHYSTEYNDEKGERAVLTTLDQMAYGGIYDQIGGGFARYSTDPNWLVPHFEKMLYDNGQLLSVYSEAYKRTQKPLYKKVIEETIAFCNRELSDGNSFYYSALDADSEGEEGKFYVWRKPEVDRLLGPDAEYFKEYFDITQSGNWEFKNVLRVRRDMDTFCAERGLDKAAFEVQVKEYTQKLFEAREQRVRPGLDDKTLTEWNALMITGLCDAYEALGETSYKDDALKTGSFIWNTLWDGESLHRNYKQGKVNINGFIDDYAATIQAYIKLYQITFDEEWLTRANTLTETSFKNFFDQGSGLFRYKSVSDKQLYVAKTPIEDNVIPSGNSTMALNLFALGHYLYNEEYLEHARTMLTSAEPYLVQHAAFYYNWLALYRKLLQEPYEVAIVGDEAEQLRTILAKEYVPNCLLLGGTKEGNLELLKMKLVEGKTMIYVCRNKTCQLPVETVDAAIEQMR
ncbi:MAG: thioredoxin domain-containing protein [Cyclobacteriaceae bacterium]|nr:thioredoxin domain-containing protein [Cyclobacteriaceae bacterium]